MIKDLLPWKKSKANEVPARQSDAVTDLHRKMNDLFNSFFDDFDNTSWWPSSISKELKQIFPNFEVSETDEALDISAELPGMDAKDINVSIDGNLLSIKGEKKDEHEDKKKNVHITERRYGSFQRSLDIPAESLDLDKVESNFTKGVLHLKLPKTAEAKSRRRKIEVTT